MFEKLGEIEVFKQTGLVPVFFGADDRRAEDAGLVYMLVHDSLAARDKNWSAFAGSPEWAKVRQTPGYSDADIVSNITTWLLRPSAASQIVPNQRSLTSPFRPPNHPVFRLSIHMRLFQVLDARRRLCLGALAGDRADVITARPVRARDHPRPPDRRRSGRPRPRGVARREARRRRPRQRRLERPRAYRARRRLHAGDPDHAARGLGRRRDLPPQRRLPRGRARHLRQDLRGAAARAVLQGDGVALGRARRRSAAARIRLHRRRARAASSSRAAARSSATRSPTTSRPGTSSATTRSTCRSRRSTTAASRSARRSSRPTRSPIRTRLMSRWRLARAKEVFKGSATTGQLKRKLPDLVDWLRSRTPCRPAPCSRPAPASSSRSAPASSRATLS